MTKNSRRDWFWALAESGRQGELVAAIVEDANVDTFSASILLADLAFQGGLDYSKALIAKGAALDSTTEEGVTALGNCMFGAVDRKNTFELFGYLLESGADPNAYARQGMTPIQIAIELNLPEYAVLLLLYGADISKSAHVLGPREDAKDTARRCRQAWAAELLRRWQRGNTALIRVGER